MDNQENQKYKEFRNGSSIKFANQLVYDAVSQGYDLLSVSDVMKMMSNDATINVIRNSGTDTRDAMVYDREGNAKIILDSKHILSMNYETKYNLTRGLPLTDEEFENLAGNLVLNISKNRIKEINGKRHRSIESILDSKELNFLARDPKILSECLNYTIPLIGKSPGDFQKIGGFELQNLNRTDGPTLYGISIAGPMYLCCLSVKDLFNCTNNYICKKKE